MNRLAGFLVLCLCSVVFGALGGLLIMNTWIEDFIQNHVYHSTRRQRGVDDAIKNSFQRFILEDGGDYKEREATRYANESCSICLGPFENGETITVLPCLHFYHDPCLSEWIKNHHICPLCKKNLNDQQHSADVSYNNIIRGNDIETGSQRSQQILSAPSSAF